MKNDRLKRGFEIYYFDGLGNRQGPIDYEELLELLGALSDTEQAGPDTALYNRQLTLPYDPSTSEDAVPDRIVEEQAGAGVGDETAEGVRE